MAEAPKAEYKPNINLKIFNKYEVLGISTADPSLAEYFSVTPCSLPHSHGRHSKHRFYKRELNIVERLANKLMVTGHMKANRKHIWATRQLSGRKTYVLRMIEAAFDKVAVKTKKNPVQLLVDATINSAPRAEITAVEYGGVRHPVSVDVAPLRRIDLALSFIAKGAVQKSIKSKTKLIDALADEIVLASANDMKSFSVARKDSIERQAEASK